MITAEQASNRTHAALNGMMNNPLMTEIKTFLDTAVETAIIDAADEGLRSINLDVQIPKEFQVRPEHLDFVLESMFKELDPNFSMLKYCINSSFMVNFQISWPKV